LRGGGNIAASRSCCWHARLTWRRPTTRAAPHCGRRRSQQPCRWAEALIAHRANLNARARNGFTPLSAAARKGGAPIVALLLQAGADANLPDTAGFTPLHIAVEKTNRPVVQVFACPRRRPKPRVPRRADSVAHGRGARGSGDPAALVGPRARFYTLVAPLERHSVGRCSADAKRRPGFCSIGNPAGPRRAAERHDPAALGRTAGNPDLVRLLLEYGAPVDAMSSSLGTPSMRRRGDGGGASNGMRVLRH